MGNTLMRIGVLGLGTITSALVEGIGNDGHTIIVSERNATNSARLSEKFRSVAVAKNQSVVDTSDVIFLGLTDGVYQDALSGLTFREGQKIVSLMAGPQIAEVAPLVAPAQLVARMIPFPSISTGGFADFSVRAD
jgi:pyrroline-5-carboxylate reductase